MQFNFYSPAMGPAWSPETIETGLGGSETYHIELAIRLARRGHTVVSFNDTPQSKYVDGVEWRDLSKLDFRLPGVWIVQRDPAFIQRFAQRSTQRYWYVFHDFDHPEATLDTLSKYNRSLSLCNTHHEFFSASKAPARITLSASGIASDRMALLPEVERNPLRLIYSSTPERGLEAVLQSFSRARDLVPGLELHCFYGWEGFDLRMPLDATGDMRRMKASIENLLTQPGVTFHGKVGQTELWTEFLKSGIWVYQTQYMETFCISACEAQALGAVPIFNPIWALRDNVQHGIALVGNCWKDRLVQTRFAYEMARLAMAPAIQEQIRKEMMPWARAKFDWERVVDQYEAMANEDFGAAETIETAEVAHVV